ncbi:hypothetical protein Pmani_000723 [Petrolisthes manimaculis]|uniref:Uncharacterized protein n=1 Tax=Petrolisthes manimaculis TaxID=1843537 RepID=A0AAE1QNK9_9EUCA|nr:hypothetical protein Pmani_000723 [Petrolisthes manimaculis]
MYSIVRVRLYSRVNLRCWDQSKETTATITNPALQRAASPEGPEGQDTVPPCDLGIVRGTYSTASSSSLPTLPHSLPIVTNVPSRLPLLPHFTPLPH